MEPGDDQEMDRAGLDKGLDAIGVELLAGAEQDGRGQGRIGAADPAGKDFTARRANPLQPSPGAPEGTALAELRPIR